MTLTGHLKSEVSCPKRLKLRGLSRSMTHMTLFLNYARVGLQHYVRISFNMAKIHSINNSEKAS